MPRSCREKRRNTDQQRAIHAMGVSRAWGAAADCDQFPRRYRWHGLGWYFGRSEYRIRLRKHFELRESRVDRETSRRISRSIRSRKRVWQSRRIKILGPEGE